jgi:gamma-glutamyltranspeptidase/glutathione hydrolase
MNRRSLITCLGLCIIIVTGLLWSPPAQPQGSPVAMGRGGAVASTDVRATQIGIEVLRSGGNAVDAAIATAAAD